MSGIPRASDSRQKPWHAWQNNLHAAQGHPGWLLRVCLVGIFATSFPMTLLSISVKPIATELHSLPTTITWVTTAPLLAGAVATPLLGRLGDLRGHRLVYLIGLAVAVLFSALTAISWDATSLITFRTLSQLGAAATVPASFAMVFRCFPREQRVRAAALTSATIAGAAVIGVVVGGPLVDLFGWRPIFAVQAVVALLALLPALLVLPTDLARRNEPLDYRGALALGCTTFTLTFGINRLAAIGPAPWVVILLATFPVSLLTLLAVERRAASPVLPLGLLALPQVRAVIAGTFILSAGWMGSFLVTPLLLQSVMGLSTGATALVSVPRAGFVTLASPVAGRLGMRYGERRLVRWAATGVALSFLLLALGARLESALMITVALGLGGWAFGHVQPGLVAAIGNAVDERDLGIATSLQQTANQVGAVVGMGLFTSLAADASTARPFVVVYLLAAGSAVGCLIACWRLRRGHPLEPVGTAGAVHPSVPELPAPTPA